MKRLYGWRGILCTSVPGLAAYVLYVLAQNEAHRGLGGGVTPPDYVALGRMDVWGKGLFDAFLVLLLFNLLFAIYGFMAGKKRSLAFFLPSVLVLLCCWGSDILLQNFYATPASSAALLLEVWLGTLILAAIIAAACFPRIRRRKEKRD